MGPPVFLPGGHSTLHPPRLAAPEERKRCLHIEKAELTNRSKRLSEEPHDLPTL